MTTLPTHPPNLVEAVCEAQSDGIDENLGRWLSFVGHASGDAGELQALNVRFGQGVRSYGAHFTTLEQAVLLLKKSEREHDCAGVYQIANPILAAVATRGEAGKWHPMLPKESTSDADIACRAVLYVDVDAQRPKGTSATDSQVATALEVASEVDTRIATILPDVMRGAGHSGNGGAVFLALDFLGEADASPLIRGILVALAQLDARKGVVEIDTSVSDAKRLIPAWGTTKRKGAPGIPTHPHRRTAFVFAEGRRANLDDLSRLLEALRAETDADGNAAIDKAMGIKPAPRSTTSPKERSYDDGPFSRAKQVDMRSLLSVLDLWEDHQPVCPGCGLQDNGVAVVGNGLKCSHNRCSSKGYRDGFRTTVDVVVEKLGCSPVEAVSWLAERFNFEGLPERQDVLRLAPHGGANVENTQVSSWSPPSPASRVRSLAELGPVVRLATGIETLDKACRGGIPTRRLVVLGGAPGAGKTSLATWLGWRWAKAGVPVAFLAVDEGPEGVLMRIAQLEGIDPTGIEERDPESLEHLAALVEATPLDIVDAEEGGTVEGVAELLATRDPTEPRVLVVDSMQTVRATGTDDAESPRERVDAVVRSLKAARDKHGLLVLATCELARGAYRSRVIAETISDLAAFKESGGIEYAAQTALVLRSVPDEANLVDVTVPKNRAFRRAPFRLRLDHRTTAFEEVPLGSPAESDDDSKMRKARQRVRVDGAKLAEIILRHPGLGERQLRAEVQRSLGWGVLRLDAAKRELGERLVNRGTGTRSSWWVVGVSKEGPADDA